MPWGGRGTSTCRSPGAPWGDRSRMNCWTSRSRPLGVWARGGVAGALGKWCVQLLKPLLLTLCFMHCRNVEMVEHQRPEKLQRKFEKRGDARATVKYKTLVIEPMRRVLDQE